MPAALAVATPSVDVKATANANASEKVEGSVSAKPEEADAEFLSPITVGGQQMMMDFDTGSSDM